MSVLKRSVYTGLALLLACALQAQIITPSQLEFEVASIKPSSGIGECVSRDPGRYTCKQSLKDLIIIAFEVPQYQSSDPMFVRASPIYEQVYEIVATVPKASPKKWGIPPNGNFEERMAMLRNLRIDRFKLVYHYEKKEVQGYSLTAEHSTFTPKSDPTPRPIGAPKDYVSPAGTVSRPTWRAPAENWLSVTRASMGRFAEGLSRWVFKGIPITDDTGLTDVYSFNLHYQSLDYSASPATREASEPLPTIFEALHRQGLKLTSKRVVVDILVVDHVEKGPIGN
jgi:uncharacterized protein (TIGR03435 family)